MSITMMQTVAAYREGSNLWPLMLIFAAPLAVVWLFPASFLFPEPWTRYGRLRLRRRSEPPVHRNLGHRLSRARRLARAQILWQGIGRALLAHRHHAVDRVTPGQCHRRCQPVPVEAPHRMRKKAHRPGLKREAHPGGTGVELSGEGVWQSICSRSDSEGHMESPRCGQRRRAIDSISEVAQSISPPTSTAPCGRSGHIWFS